MEIALIIIAVIASILSLAIATIVLIVLLKKNNSSSKEEIKDLQKQQIEGFTKLETKVEESKVNTALQVKAEINAKIAEQNESLQKSFKEQMISDDKRIQDFQEKTNSFLNSQVNIMNEKIENAFKKLDEKVSTTINEQFKGTSDSMEKIQKQLGAMEEAQKNLQNLDEKVTDLNQILGNNQKRGRYGEWQLELLLENMFEGGKGTLYDTQYYLVKAKGDEQGLKPDAVIFLDGEAGSRIVPIDSKFSITGYQTLINDDVENEEVKHAKAEFKKALKDRIEETSKYIIKGKTINNALMFIPSDGMYAYIESELSDIVEEGFKKGVVLVSPTILQPLLGAFRVIQNDAKRSKNIDIITNALQSLGKNFKLFDERWNKLSSEISKLPKKVNDFDISVQKIGTNFKRIENVDTTVTASIIDEEPIEVLPSPDEDEE